MSRSNQEAWHLLGGWAAGTLTEEERATLLSAAMEDQELFDALADEEALKELLGDEALRLRLASDLAPARRSPLLTWVWGAGSVLAGLALVMVFRQDPGPPLVQLAKVEPGTQFVSAPREERQPAEIRAKLPGAPPPEKSAERAPVPPPQPSPLSQRNEASPPAPALISPPPPVIQDALPKREQDGPPAAAVAEERARRQGTLSPAGAARPADSAAPPAASSLAAADAVSPRLTIVLLQRDPALPGVWREVGGNEIVEAGAPLRVRVSVPGPGILVLRTAAIRSFPVDGGRTVELDLAPYQPGEHTVRVEWSAAGSAAEKAARKAFTMNQADMRSGPPKAAASRVLRVR